MTDNTDVNTLMEFRQHNWKFWCSFVKGNSSYCQRCFTHKEYCDCKPTGIVYARQCDECKKGMNEGYCIADGAEYYCSDNCANKHYTDNELAKMYKDGDSYWTDWLPEEEDSGWDKDMNYIEVEE